MLISLSFEQFADKSIWKCHIGIWNIVMVVVMDFFSDVLMNWLIQETTGKLADHEQPCFWVDFF